MISIALATYNGEKFISQQLDSILQQTFSNFEVICVDDNSIDSTYNILEKYSKADKRIKCFKNKKQLGFKKNFERAISLCTGEFVAFCDQDDVWTENHLQILLDNIKDNDIVVANAMMVDGDLNSLNYTMRECLGIVSVLNDSEYLNRHTLYRNVFQGAASMVTESVAKKMIPIPDEVRYHDYWAAAIAACYKGCAYTDDIVLYYRQHGANVTTNKHYTLKNGLINSLNFKSIYDSNVEQKFFLTELLKRCESTSLDKINFIKEAIKYYQAITNFNIIKKTFFFVKQYKYIYYGKEQTVRFKVLRFIKNVIL